MRSTSVKPSAYPPLPFHLIRIVGFLSSLIVAIILAVFIYHLSKDKHKLPWAFLVLLISSVLSLLNYILTSISHCTAGLSPRLSLVCNSILFVLWLISLGLLSWSMSGTILTTCNATYWATATGITVCRVYKVLFSFTVVGALAHVAAIALDVIVHRRQTRLGRYDPMESSPALPDYKSHDRSSSIMSTGALPAANDAYLMADYPHPVHPAFARPDDYDDDARSPLYPAHAHRHPVDQPDFYDVPHPDDRPSRYSPSMYEGPRAAYGDVSPVRSERDGPHVRFAGHGTAYDPGAYR
ncbi:hypothetical protein BDV59DRAFT_161415 [Aspergillus ambiguus]|uniref:uncharacterized protein n=1 Tax=Aspergillus ambiguus TaxID=176160 RepID=UPI003CCCFC8C